MIYLTYNRTRKSTGQHREQAQLQQQTPTNNKHGLKKGTEEAKRLCFVLKSSISPEKSRHQQA